MFQVFPVRKTTSPNDDNIHAIANGSGTASSYTSSCSSLQAAVNRSFIEQLDVIRILLHDDESQYQRN